MRARRSGELVRMSKCKNCGVEIGPEETCVFATYRTNVGGREIIVCCPNCASDLEREATEPVEPQPAVKAPAKKPARKARKARKAVKAKRRVNKKRPAQRSKRAARKPARRRRK